MFNDGSLNVNESGEKIISEGLKGPNIHQIMQFNFNRNNNQEECEAYKRLWNESFTPQSQ